MKKCKVIAIANQKGGVAKTLADMQTGLAFPNHPFKFEKNEELEEMGESIKNGGVRQLVIVRTKEDGCYEMVSGHRRKLASEIAGLKEIPAIIRE